MTLEDIALILGTSRKAQLRGSKPNIESLGPQYPFCKLRLEDKSLEYLILVNPQAKKELSCWSFATGAGRHRSDVPNSCHPGVFFNVFQ